MPASKLPTPLTSSQMHDKIIALKSDLDALRYVALRWKTLALHARAQNEELEWRVKRLEAELRGR